MDEARVEAVVGRPLPRRPAVLEGYERLHPVGSYPYVVARAGARVEGVLLDEVDDTALARLDAYEDEGGLYVRQETVALVDGGRIACDVYVGTGITTARGRG